jgi:hypothetical protein
MFAVDVTNSRLVIHWCSPTVRWLVMNITLLTLNYCTFLLLKQSSCINVTIIVHVTMEEICVGDTETLLITRLHPTTSTPHSVLLLIRLILCWRVESMKCTRHVISIHHLAVMILFARLFIATGSSVTLPLHDQYSTPVFIDHF